MFVNLINQLDTNGQDENGRKWIAHLLGPRVWAILSSKIAESWKSKLNFNSRYRNWSSKPSFLSTVPSGDLFLVLASIYYKYICLQIQSFKKSPRSDRHISQNISRWCQANLIFVFVVLEVTEHTVHQARRRRRGPKGTHGNTPGNTTCRLLLTG